MKTINQALKRQAQALIGQRCVIKGGGTVKGYVGIVVGWRNEFPFRHIEVMHPVTKVIKHYDPDNVSLISL